MRIIYIELVGSHGGTLNSCSVNIPDDADGEKLINEAVQKFVHACILNPGDAIRISEYQG